MPETLQRARKPQRLGLRAFDRIRAVSASSYSVKCFILLPMLPAHDISNVHLEFVQKAIASRQEGDWHDFKEGLFEKKQIDDLRKDLVALANTPAGPYGSSRYIIVGVDDAGQVLGLSGKDASRTLDEQVRRIGDIVSRSIHPPIALDLREYEVEGKRLLIIVVPEADGRWHLVSGDESHGFWVRRNWASVRPLASDYEAYFARQLQVQVDPLREEFLRLDERFSLLRREMVEGGSLVGETLSAADHVRRVFLTPERTLIRLARQEAITFTNRRSHHWTLIDAIQPDRLEEKGLGLPEDERARLRAIFEEIETDTRPLIELAATIIHDADVTPRVEQALEELTSVITHASVREIMPPPGAFALGVYPALLYLHAVAASAAPSSDWRLLAHTLHHSEDVPSLSLSRRHVHLASVLVWRGPLDEVARLIEPGRPQNAAAHRMERLLHRSDWIGLTLPIQGQLGAYSRGEATLTFGYLAAALRAGVSSPPALKAQWWTYLNANAILEVTMERYAQRGQVVLGDLPLSVLAEAFDRMDKSGAHLTLKASLLAAVLQIATP